MYGPLSITCFLLRFRVIVLFKVVLIFFRGFGVEDEAPEGRRFIDTPEVRWCVC